MREKIRFIIHKIKAGRLQEMWKQALWIYWYVRSYWAAFLLYTLLGMAGTVVSLLAGLVSKDLIVRRLFQNISGGLGVTGKLPYRRSADALEFGCSHGTRCS